MSSVDVSTPISNNLDAVKGKAIYQLIICWYRNNKFGVGEMAPLAGIGVTPPTTTNDKTYYHSFFFFSHLWICLLSWPEKEKKIRYYRESNGP